MTKRILITGGTGFIGHVLCRELLARDHELTVSAGNRQKPSKPAVAGLRLSVICNNSAPTQGSMPSSIWLVKALLTSDGQRIVNSNFGTAGSVSLKRSSP